jgi:DNA polymerase-3 subunit alpha
LKFSDILRRYANSDTSGLMQCKDQSTARIGGLIASIKEIATRKGDRMAFATLEDLSGTVELVIFSDVYRLKSELFKSDEPIFIVGKVDVGEDQAKIIVADAVPLSEARRLFKGTVHIHFDATAVNDAALHQLRELLTQYKGECPTVLHFKIPGKSETILSLPKEFAISPSETLVKELGSLFGPATEIQFG